jgi:hypothetical protein
MSVRNGTDPTTPRSIPGNLCALRRIGMSLRAYQNCTPKSREGLCAGSEKILPMRHRPKMRRVDAASLSADVIQLHSGWDFPNHQFIDHTVCPRCLSIVAHGPVAAPEPSVSPQPTSLRNAHFLDLLVGTRRSVVRTLPV